MVAAANDAGDVMVRADQPSNAALQQDVDGFGQLAVLFPLLFLVAGALAAYVLLGRLVRTQRGQIGMLTRQRLSPPPAPAPLHRLRRSCRASWARPSAPPPGSALAVWLTSTYTSSLGIPLAVARFHPLTPIVGVRRRHRRRHPRRARPRPRRRPGRAGRSDAWRRPPRRRPPQHPRTRAGHARPAGPGAARAPQPRAQPPPSAVHGYRRRRSPPSSSCPRSACSTPSRWCWTTSSTRSNAKTPSSTWRSPPTRRCKQLRTPPGVAQVEPAIEAPVVLSNGSRRYQTVARPGSHPTPPCTASTRRSPMTASCSATALRTTLGVDVGQTVDLTVAGGSPGARQSRRLRP